MVGVPTMAGAAFIVPRTRLAMGVNLRHYIFSVLETVDMSGFYFIITC